MSTIIILEAIHPEEGHFQICPRKKPPEYHTTRDDAEKGVKFLAFFALLRAEEEEEHSGQAQDFGDT